MPPREHQLATSVLVVGTGGAGLRAAIELAEAGVSVLRVLGAHTARLGVPVLSTCCVTRLWVDHGSVFGAYGFDLHDGSRYLIHADAVIVAAGGHTRLCGVPLRDATKHRRRVPARRRGGGTAA